MVYIQDSSGVMRHTRGERAAVVQDGVVVVEGGSPWPDGTRLVVSPLPVAGQDVCLQAESVIVAGFGLAGRCVADHLEKAGVRYTVIETNPATVATQRCLGRAIIEGDVRDEATLRAAGIETACVLALTIPDESAVLEATGIARRLRPDLYIIARTNYASAGMKALQLGANEVIKAEQAVAFMFHERLRRKLCQRPEASGPRDRLRANSLAPK